MEIQFASAIFMMKVCLVIMGLLVIGFIALEVWSRLAAKDWDKEAGPDVRIVK